MPDDEVFAQRVRAQLDSAANDLTAPADLARMVRARYRRRRLRRGGAAGLGVLFVMVGAVTASALTGAPHRVGASTVDLAGYEVTLPPGVHASSLQFLPEPSDSLAPPSPSIFIQCQRLPLGVLFNQLPQWGPPPYKEPTSTNIAITSPSGSGCISALMTLPYGSGTAFTPDAVAPSGSTSVDIGPYAAREYPTAGLGLASVEFAYYVQLPSSGGGYQDLIVGSLDIPRAEVIRIVQQIVAAYESITPAIG